VDFNISMSKVGVDEAVMVASTPEPHALPSLHRHMRALAAKGDRLQLELKEYLRNYQYP
jgi:hypothetical protein